MHYNVTNNVTYDETEFKYHSMTNNVFFLKTKHMQSA